VTLATIDACFVRAERESRPVLVAYLPVGFPSVEESLRCAEAALEAGADLLELGVPFSDPSADGPVIARASYEAIAAGGSLRQALEVARQLRRRHTQPMVLFSYYNPVVAFGEDRLPRAMAEAGVDGILVVDLPPDEGEAFRLAAKAEQLAVVPLLAPTSGAEREQAILQNASGFIYYVSVTGVTGSAVAPLEEAGRHAADLTKRSGLPVVVGFGIDTVQKARQVAAAGARGLVVGTALVRAIAEADGESPAAAVGRLIAELRLGLAPASSPAVGT
jgi:tryptophan synthase alpha chain